MIRLKSVSIIVKGRVQGVAYRYYTELKATELNLDGSVQNIEDGSVHILATGEDGSIDSLIEWCSHGSPASKVTELTVKEVPLIEINSAGFNVIR